MLANSKDRFRIGIFYLLLIPMVMFTLLTSVFGAPAPAPAPQPSNPISDLLGPGSRLEADGEFEMIQGDDGELSKFRAVDNVSLETKDFSLTCDEMTYNKPEGKILALAGRKSRVNIIMRNVNTAGPVTSQSITRASCGRYEYFVNARKHVLTQDPIIHQRGQDGKETVISGRTIILTQDPNGRTNMLVQRGARMYDPKTERAREMKGLSPKPIVNIDMQPPKTEAAKPVTPPKTAKIDEGNVGTLQQPKPSRIVRLEEGG